MPPWMRGAIVCPTVVLVRAGRVVVFLPGVPPVLPDVEEVVVFTVWVVVTFCDTVVVTVTCLVLLTVVVVVVVLSF